LPDGRKLITLKDAADYVMKLPKSESDLPEWQMAIEMLMSCFRGGDAMLARIGVKKALNRHVERVFNPDAKKHHWGKRKPTREGWRTVNREIALHNAMAAASAQRGTGER
jgi:hypothetical protein